MSIYQYQPLPEDRMVRLLDFLPGDSPSVRVITTRLDDAPQYAALSYTWGENIFNHTMTIDGGFLNITENLSDALAALFRTVRDCNLKFWIDAVCINQSDLDERGSQVSFMDEIYKSAQKVHVWLGKKSSDSDLAMTKMAQWSSEITDGRTGSMGFGNYQEAILKAAAKNGHFCGPPGTEPHRAWMAILSLWSRPWWRRVWIVQETVPLPEDRISIHCGSRVIGMACLRHILDLRYNLVVYSEENDFLMTTFEQGFAEVLDNTSAHLTYSPRPLKWVLERLRTFECKDARDKVYAALSMACDFPRGRIRPDYTLHVADVYVNVVQELSSAGDEHSLDFLGNVVRPVPGLERLTLLDDSIPTWVPDWRGPKMDITPLRKYIDYHNEETSPRAYNATLDSRPQMRISERQLNIRGAIIDSIASVLPVCANTRISDTSVEKAWSHDNSTGSYIAGGTVSEAYRHAMLADVDVLDVSRDHSALRRGAFVDWQLVDAPTAELSNEEGAKRAYLLNNLKCAALGRRLYVTERGYIGLGPGACEPGDQVCLFLGGQVFYVLRRKNGVAHEFVGESYLHGLMDGEAFDADFESGGVQFILV